MEANTHIDSFNTYSDENGNDVENKEVDCIYMYDVLLFPFLSSFHMVIMCKPQSNNIASH